MYCLLLYYRISPKHMSGRVLSHNSAINYVIDLIILKIEKHYRPHHTKKNVHEKNTGCGTCII